MGGWEWHERCPLFSSLPFVEFTHSSMRNNQSSHTDILGNTGTGLEGGHVDPFSRVRANTALTVLGEGEVAVPIREGSVGGPIRGSGSPARMFLGRGHFEIRQRAIRMIRKIKLSLLVTQRDATPNGLASGVLGCASLAQIPRTYA